MQKTVATSLALALLAGALPGSLFAQESELATSAPGTAVSEQGEVSQPESQTLPTSFVTDTTIFSNTSTQNPISVIGFSGGAYLFLSEQLVARSTGSIAEIDLYISQYSGGTDRSIRIDIYDASNTTFLCSVLNIGESYGPGPRLDGWNLVPFTDVAPEFITLSSTDRVGDPGNCVFTTGETYTVRLGISASSVNGTARLFTAGDLPENFHFVARTEITPPSLCTENCYSNVLFLPGIKGSVLKDGSDTRNKLWPPTIWTDDVERLALTEEGESINSVVVGEVLGDFYGTPVYRPFVSYLDGLVEGNTIQEWLPVPYDWRFSPEKILSEGVKTASGTVDILAETKDLAARARNGKVIIVAHSMGGLLGKALIRELENRGEEEIVEAFVMVGSPQLGTPQGATSLLHGDDEAILGGTIVDASDVRAVGQNMQSAYNLLPSAKYFDSVSDPVFLFDDNADFTSSWRSQWGTSTDSYSEYKEFVVDSPGLRTRPQSEELLKPEILRETLIQEAESFHDLYDQYVVPENVHVVQIAGWGAQTLKGVMYLNEDNEQAYQALFTREGDKTVVYPSAVSSDAEETYYLNLDTFRDPDNKIASHKDLLSTEPIQEIISSTIRKENIGLPTHLSYTKPSVSDTEDQLLISTHSPVLLRAQDTLGRFTGINPLQPENGGFLQVEENIPGSTFIVLGGDNYAFLPASGSYTFTFKGTGNGVATVKTGVITEDTASSTLVFTNIPVTPQTEGVFSIAPGTSEVFIELDVEGDGIIDSFVVPDGYVPPSTLAELLLELKAQIIALNIKPKLKEKLLKKIEKLEKKIHKQQNRPATRLLLNLEKRIVKKTSQGNISDTEAEAILDLLKKIEDEL